jgi:predicted DNA-binding transcriptional regulator YafY
MNRIERIAAILIQLQSKKIVRGQDIANRFAISLRTVYRDMKVLEESGVPIISEAGIGYSLMDGYRLPPITFTKEEAIAFLTAEKMIEKLTDASTYQVYQSALFKIKAVLTKEDKEQVEKMNSSIEIVKNPYLRQVEDTSDHIQIILDCIAKKHQLEIEYFAQHNQQKSTRRIEPVGIFLMYNKWHLIAFCLLRKDYRNFRIDRIVKSKHTGREFSKAHPPLKTYLKVITKEEHDLHTIVIRVENKYLKYLGDQKFYNGFVSEKKIKDQTEMTFLTTSIEGFARWYMMYGDFIEIVSPISLKIRVKEIMAAIRKKIN